MEGGTRADTSNGAVSDADRAVARRLADELRESSGQLRTWRKVTTLLDMFGVYGLTDASRKRIDAALSEATLRATPAISDVKRHETVRLSLPESALGAADVAASEHGLTTPDYSVWEPMRAVTASDWRPRQRPVEISLFQALAGDRVVWFEVNVLHADPEDVFDALEPLCPGLTGELVEALLEGRIGTDFDASAVARVATIAAVGTATRESRGDADDAAGSKAGQLVFQPVEMIAGESWLVTCWHKSRRYRGAKEVRVGEPRGYDEVYGAVAERWSREDLRTAGDLGMLIVHELAAGHAAALRDLEAWLESWELDFYRRLDETERETLIELRGLVAEFRSRLNALHVRGQDLGSGWLPGLTQAFVVEEIDELVERSLKGLRELNDLLRTSLELIAANTAAKQLELGQRRARQSEQVQRQIGLVTSVLLMPTMVASIFGANTSLPGRERWTGFLLMLVLMVIAGLCTYGLFHKIASRSKAALDEEGSAEDAER